MEDRLTFTEYKRRLSDRATPLEELGEYLEFDPDSGVPKLRFRNDALLDSPPDDFDIDDYVYNLLQEIDENAYASEEEFRLVGKKRVVAEGDSWMNLPLIMRWKSIGDTLKSRNNYRVKNIGKWGHTIDAMVKHKEYMEVIDKKQPDFFVFSGGGNDLQDKLKVGGIIKAYDPDLPANKYLTQDGVDAIAKIEEQYREMIKEITSTFPDVKIFTHGYDYPRPLLDGGKYLGKHLRKRGIPDEMMSPIFNNVIDILGASIERVVNDFSTAYHVNVIGKTDEYTWRNDFHPKNKGFEQIAICFEKAMG